MNFLTFLTIHMVAKMQHQSIINDYSYCSVYVTVRDPL